MMMMGGGWVLREGTGYGWMVERGISGDGSVGNSP